LHLAHTVFASWTLWVCHVRQPSWTLDDGQVNWCCQQVLWCENVWKRVKTLWKKLTINFTNFFWDSLQSSQFP